MPFLAEPPYAIAETQDLVPVIARSFQQAESGPGDEIVVTGERIPRTQRETASSVTVLTANAIEKRAEPDRIEQLLQTVPNVQLGSGGDGPTIRGQDSTGVVRELAAFLAGSRPRLSLQADGRSISYYELAFGLTSIWDVERVEVFRSPQTTTQGRNSIGGAIFIETRSPTFEWEGKVRMLAGNFDTRQLSGAVSGPLLGEQVAFRASGDVRRSRVASRITNPAVGIDPNKDDSEAVRFKLTTKPDALPGTQFELTYFHGRSQMPQIEGVEQPYRLRRNPNATYGIFAINVDSLTGRFSYEPLADLSARATLSYGNADVRRFAPPGLGEATIDTSDFSVEPIVDWRASPRLHLTLGVNYVRARLDQAIDITAQPFGAGAFADKQSSLGVFGETSWSLTPALKLTAGLRYQRDRQIRKGALIGGSADVPIDYDGRFHAVLPKLSIAWDLTPAVRIGALAQRAYNPGGVNINLRRFRAETFGAERLWDYELFARASLAGGKFTLSANAFYYDIADAQRPQNIAFTSPNGTVIFTSQVDNAPAAWTTGAELEFSWQPSKQLSLRGAIGLLDTRISRTLTDGDPLLGKQFQRSPHFTASASFDWRPVERLQLSAQARRNSGYFSDDTENPFRRIAGSTTADAKASSTFGNVTLFGYVRNLFNEFHLTYRFEQSSGLATAGDPREFGFGASANF